MDDHDLESIRDLLAAASERPELKWPEPASAPSMPQSEGASASQFEPVVGRLERVAQMLEGRADDQSAKWGRAGKVYENQSLGGLISQMPIPQAMGFVHQSWGLPSQSPGEPARDWQMPIPKPDETDRTGALPPVADLWPEPQLPTAPNPIGAPSPAAMPAHDPDAMPWFPDARPTRLVAGSKDTHLQAPGVIPGPDASGPAPVAAGDDLVQALESLRQSVEDLRQQMTATNTPTAGTAPSPAGGSVPQAASSQRSQVPTPPSGRTTMPAARDAHLGGMPSTWDQARARVTGV